MVRDKNSFFQFVCYPSKVVCVQQRRRLCLYIFVSHNDRGLSSAPSVTAVDNDVCIPTRTLHPPPSPPPTGTCIRTLWQWDGERGRHGKQPPCAQHSKPWHTNCISGDSARGTMGKLPPGVPEAEGLIPPKLHLDALFCCTLQLNFLLYMHAVEADILMSLFVRSLNDSPRSFCHMKARACMHINGTDISTIRRGHGTSPQKWGGRILTQTQTPNFRRARRPQ